MPDYTYVVVAKDKSVDQSPIVVNVTEQRDEPMARKRVEAMGYVITGKDHPDTRAAKAAIKATAKPAIEPTAAPAEAADAAPAPLPLPSLGKPA